MSAKKKILIVDDNAVNRKILCKILNEYDTIQAENGQTALDLLHQYGEDVSLVLLDIMMPIMDGYAFLDAIKTEQGLSGIPVIVMTSSDNEADEIRCLTNGASDFVKKPYNPEIVKHRVASILRLRESSAMLNMLKFDQLTGLYSKEFFYQQVARILEQYPDKIFDIICSDVENFRLVNERYGSQMGDEVLRCIANVYRSSIKEHGVCARIGADVFALLVEHQEEYFNETFAKESLDFDLALPISNFVVKFGVYENVDRNLAVSSMCDRATLALNRIKNQYGKNFAFYDDSMRLTLLREQQILDSMEEALSQEQFEVYYQPKHDIFTGAIIGAEALVRWAHPQFGFISPGEFIPLFEKNGFITKMDFYIWEQVCKTIEGWKQSGIPVLPISVNVSRVDFNVPELAGKIRQLAEAYGIDHDLIHLEVTESAYTDNPQQIIAVVNELRKMGFKIEMDDFGSGYSSLNMLSELPIDILKLDMGFMKQTDSFHKKSILKFIISLSKWLDLETVAEGVEDIEQLDDLRSMGCNFVQGYVYAKPMPKGDFEAYCMKAEEDKSALNTSEKPGQLNSKQKNEMKHTVLVVEDVKINRDILRKILSPDYQIVEAKNGKEAYDYLKKHKESVSAILLDLMLPVMDGFQFLQRIKENTRLFEIPIIITSDTGSKSELQALKLGADGFVAKPYEPELLRYQLKRAIDFSESKKTKEYLEKQQQALTRAAYHDSLTNFYNRRGLSKAILQLPNAAHAVFMLDIDNLKNCNDTYGHDCGDKLIQIVVDMLREETRTEDVLARIGGDEFVVVMKNLSSAQAALRKGARVCESIKNYISQNYKCCASCSIGVAIMADITQFEETCKLADRALYKAKQENKGGCCLWEEEV